MPCFSPALTARGTLNIPKLWRSSDSPLLKNLNSCIILECRFVLGGSFTLKFNYNFKWFKLQKMDFVGEIVDWLSPCPNLEFVWLNQLLVCLQRTRERSWKWPPVEIFTKLRLLPRVKWNTETGAMQHRPAVREPNSRSSRLSWWPSCSNNSSLIYYRERPKTRLFHTCGSQRTKISGENVYLLKKKTAHTFTVNTLNYSFQFDFLVKLLISFKLSKNYFREIPENVCVVTHDISRWEDTICLKNGRGWWL